jgi:cyanophycinase-like exopeptidase
MESAEEIPGLIALVGGNEFRRSCEPMDRALLLRLGGKPRVVIVPTAAAREGPDVAARNGVNYFNELGAHSEAAMILDKETAQEPSLIAKIRKADLIYFTGGDPSHLLETMRNSLAWKAALETRERGRMLAGSSAGAMICGGQMWAPGIGWQEGLGLVPHIAIIPHHATLGSHWNVGRIRTSLPEGVMLVGIDESTALLGPPWQVLGSGQVVLYSGQGKAIFTDGRAVPLQGA